MEFTQLCHKTAEELIPLKQKTDAFAKLGYGYEISCSLPHGCAPQHATIGFFRRNNGYLLYLRSPVQYDGSSQKLAEFFTRGHSVFSSFPQLVTYLRQLADDFSTPGIPLYDQIRSMLNKHVLGQNTAIDTAALRIYTHICKSAPARPLSLVFYGPSGVGKSELAKAIPSVLSLLQPKQQWKTVWTDLNTFAQAHSVYRLIGAPPGYVGFDESPVFESVLTAPHTVFIFDELDKAHPEVLKVFMSALDEGRCAARKTGENGQTELDFRRCIFIFTTNLDLSATRKNTLGFSACEQHDAIPFANMPTNTPLPISQAFTADEVARRALIQNGVLHEIASRFTGLIGFRQPDTTARLAITGKQIAALGREFGLCILSVSPEVSAALTPAETFSIRSSTALLEGILTPLFAGHIARRGPTSIHLAGNAEHIFLSEFPPTA